MKTFTLFTTVFMLLISSLPVLTGKVIKVTDGDTITILTKDRKQVKIRLYGIECPEKNQDYGPKAKEFTLNLSFGKTVSVKQIDTDRYGRIVGEVFVG